MARVYSAPFETPPPSAAPLWLLVGYLLVWVLLAIAPVDRLDWALENILVVVCLVTLVSTYRLFRFTDLSYALLAAFLLLHAIGAHYTYAEVPLGFWLKDALALTRNPFDRIVHFGYGFFLVYPLRELLMRTADLRGFWALYLPVSGILAQSGLFEIIEMVIAILVNPELGSAYLGTQGDEWDAQKDMLAATIGSLLVIVGATWYERSVRRASAPVRVGGGSTAVPVREVPPSLGRRPL